MVEPVNKQTGRFESRCTKRSRADNQGRAAIAIDVSGGKGTGLDHVFKSANRLTRSAPSSQSVHTKFGLEIYAVRSRLNDSDRARDYVVYPVVLRIRNRDHPRMRAPTVVFDQNLVPALGRAPIKKNRAG